jgi:hypothetical protein
LARGDDSDPQTALSTKFFFYQTAIAMESDSGRIIILQVDYDPKTSSFVKLHQETYGKSGARRIVPDWGLITTAAVMHKIKVSEVYSRYCFPSQSICF